MRDDDFRRQGEEAREGYHRPPETPREAIWSAIEARLEEAVSRAELPKDVDVEALAATLIAVVQGGYTLSLARQDPSHMTRALAGARALLLGAR